MSIIEDIRQLIKKQIVIRHRTGNELQGDTSHCLICHRKLVLPPGALCLAINNEGLVCTLCGRIYAPEMVEAFKDQLPEMADDSYHASETLPEKKTVSPAEWIVIARDIEVLSEVTADLAKGIARGIVEAPAGHIGLLHYAKEIYKPPRKDNESEKDYELRVRTHRMTLLYEKIYADTTGRVEKLKSTLIKLGFPIIPG